MTQEEESKLDKIHEAILGIKPVVEDSSSRIKSIENRFYLAENEIVRHEEKLNSHEGRIKSNERHIDGVGNALRTHERNIAIHSKSEDSNFALRTWFVFLENWKGLTLATALAVSVLNVLISWLHKIPTIPVPHIQSGGIP